MTSWVNYHSHTTFCDGKATAEEMIKEAVKSGLPAYGYSSHAPVPFSSDWNMKETDLQLYIDEINTIKKKYQDRIQIYLGLEIDFIPGITGHFRDILKNAPLDFFIGSIHYLEKMQDGSFWNIDTSWDLFVKGLKEIFSNDVKRAVIRFWENTRQMIEEDRPPVIGHMDKIKMFNKNNILFSEDETWYTDQVELTLQSVKKTGSIVEINTRGYYKYGQPYLYPGEQIISKMLKYDIPLTISSDAHLPGEITEGLSYTAEVLKKMGVARLMALYHNRWQEFSFSGKGLEIH